MCKNVLIKRPSNHGSCGMFFCHRNPVGFFCPAAGWSSLQNLGCWSTQPSIPGISGDHWPQPTSSNFHPWDRTTVQIKSGKVHQRIGICILFIEGCGEYLHFFWGLRSPIQLQLYRYVRMQRYINICPWRISMDTCSSLIKQSYSVLLYYIILQLYSTVSTGFV